MKKRILIGLGLAAIVSSAATVADENPDKAHQVSDVVTVNWENPKEYTDMRPSNESRSRFLKRTLNQFDEIFAELGEQLPDGHTLDVLVTNVDLAGQVWPQQFVGLGHGGGDVRLIKNIDIPRMAFSYTLRNQGGVIKEAEVNLKDMGFLDRAIRGFDSEPLRYEKRMLERWFDKEFSDQLAKQ